MRSAYSNYNDEQIANIPAESEYLRSILRPFTGPAAIPDDNMTTSFPKAAEINQNITIAGSGRCLFLYLPHSNTAPIKMYIWVNAQNKYIYAADIAYDQDLSLDYTIGRFISGGLSLISATTSGTLFNVSGTMTAAAFQELPDVNTLTYNQITSYKRNNVDVVAGVPVSAGVTTLAFPDGNNDFGIFNTGSAYVTEAEVYAVNKYAGGAALNGWNPGPSTLFDAYDSNNNPGFIPKNCYGTVIIESKVVLTLGVGQTACVVQLTVSGTTVSPADWTTTSDTIVVDTSIQNGQTGTAVTATYINRVVWNSSIPISRIRVVVQNSPSSANLNASAQTSWVSIRAPMYYQPGLVGPGTMIGLSDMSPGQTLSLNGCGNYEVVPSSSLSKNITTNYFGAFNPLEMDLVTHYIANGVKNRIRFVWESPAYQSWVNSGAADRHLPLEKIATATGFTDFLKSIYKIAAPIMRAGLPMLGGALLGGPGAMVGQGLSELLPEASGYRYRDM